MKFKKYTVEELVKLNMLERPMDGNHGSKHPTSKDYVKKGIPFVMVSDIDNGKINYKTCKFISKKTRDGLDKGFAKPNDVLLSHKATIGLTAIVGDEFKEIVLTPQLTYYRIKKDINKKYLKYYFDSSYFQNILKSWATSGSTRAYLGITAQLKLPILLPDINIQNKVANILSVIDEKIRLNNEINNNLYEIMKLQFNNWIKNLKKYEKSNLSSIADYTNGLAMQKYRPINNEKGLPVIKIKEMHGGITKDTERCSEKIKDNVKVYDGDVLFAWSGTLCMSIWCNGTAGLNQHIFKVTSNKYPKWFYYFWTLKHLNKFIRIAEGKTTTMGHIKREELDKAIVYIPDKEDLNNMNKLMESSMDRYIKNKIENRVLTQLRDTLLPKLMNGEINLDKIEN